MDFKQPDTNTLVLATVDARILVFIQLDGLDGFGWGGLGNLEYQEIL